MEKAEEAEIDEEEEVEHTSYFTISRLRRANIPYIPPNKKSHTPYIPPNSKSYNPYIPPNRKAPPDTIHSNWNIPYISPWDPSRRKNR